MNIECTVCGTSDRREAIANVRVNRKCVHDLCTSCQEQLGKLYPIETIEYDFSVDPFRITYTDRTTSRRHDMTINELIRELRLQQRAGRGNQQVFISRYGDKYCMKAAAIKQYESHVVIVAPNPALLWPNGEQEAMCSVEDAMYDSEEARQNVEYCRNSGGSM